MIIFRHEKSAAYATLKFQWWAGMDSNHRNPKMTDLQSVPFNHSGTYPQEKMVTQEGLEPPTL